MSITKAVRLIPEVHRIPRHRGRCRIPARSRVLLPTGRRPARWAVRIRRVSGQVRHRPRWSAPGGRHPVPRDFSYRGHDIERIHMRPFLYPPGFAYRRWEIGAALPPLFLVRDYWYADWAGLGLEPPPPGYQWVRYGPDLLLVNVITGQVADVAYGVFYD